MTTRLLYFLTMIAGALFFTSCGDDDGSGGGGNPNPAEPLNFTATINGEDWAATSSTSTHVFLCQTLKISGTASDGTTLELFFENVDAPASFSLNNASISYIHYINANGQVYSSENVPSTSNIGTVLLTDFNGTDETASGQFAAGAYIQGEQLPVQIMDGSFEDIGFTTDVNSSDCPEEDPEDPENPDTMISWKIDGVLHTTDNFITDDDSNPLKKVILYGTPNGDFVSFDFLRDIEPGTFPLNSTSQDAVVNFSIDFIIKWNVSGTLTITAHDPVSNYIEGTFNADVVDSNTGNNPVSITEGEFSITYED